MLNMLSHVPIFAMVRPQSSVVYKIGLVLVDFIMYWPSERKKLLQNELISLYSSIVEFKIHVMPQICLD